MNNIEIVEVNPEPVKVKISRKEYLLAYREKNKDKFNEYQKKYQRVYRATHEEKVKEYFKKYNKKYQSDLKNHQAHLDYMKIKMTCDLCNKTFNKCNKKLHESSQTHKTNLDKPIIV